MKRTRKHVVAALVVAALLVLSGCVGGLIGGGDSGPSDRAQAVQQQSIEAMSEIDTYRTEIEMEVTVDGRSATVDAEGVVNRSAERMFMEMSIDSPGGSVTTTQYVVGDTQYVEQDGRWIERDVSDRKFWETGTRLQQQRQLFEASDAEIVGNATVNGTEVYVMKVDVDEETLEELMAQRQTSAVGASADIKDVTYRAYVAKDTGYIHKVEYDMDVEIRGQDGEISVTVRNYGFGENVTIDLPDAVDESYSSR